MTIDGRRRKAIRTIGQVSSLVDRARGLRALARVHNMTQTAKYLTVIANTLDGVRTHLVEDHEYEPIAAAFVDTASKRLVDIADKIGRARNGR
jgi:hypothetical protein